MLLEFRKRVILFVTVIAFSVGLLLLLLKFNQSLKSEHALPERVPSCVFVTCRPISSPDLCSNVSSTYQTDFQTVMQKNCIVTQGSSSGMPGKAAVCCRPKSNGTLFYFASKAEEAEFPHQVFLTAASIACGATIYNQRYLITAAHCLVNPDTGLIVNIPTIVTIIGTNSRIFAFAPEFLYQVKSVIIHPKYGGLATTREWSNRAVLPGTFFNDIALLELDRNIVFSETVKPLKLAPKGFDPFKFADTAVVVGWSTTDNNKTSEWLQKSNFHLQPEPCFEIYEIFKDGKDRLLCAGGAVDEVWSGIAGDSGGPAICRDQNEHPVLCGIVSFVNVNESKTCHWSQGNEYCIPSMFVEVAFFHKWIVSIAGLQDDKDLYKPYLYGKTVDEKQYLHQVRITSQLYDSDVHNFCIGALIEPDIVITDADCVTGEHFTVFSQSIESMAFGVKMVKTFPVYETNKVSRKRRAILEVAEHLVGTEIKEQFAANNLAVVLLNKSVPISQNDLPRFPRNSEVCSKGLELSIGFDGLVMSREFAVLRQDECRTRMTVLNLTVEENVFCGVEKYSGGSTCDRDYGGGYFCAKGKMIGMYCAAYP